MDPASSTTRSSIGGPVRRRQRDQEEKLPPHRVLWRDEVRAVKVGYDIAGTYVTNADSGETALLPPLYFLLEVAHGQQRRELEADFELRTARMMQEQDDLRRQVVSLQIAKMEGIEKQPAGTRQNRNGNAAAALRSFAKVSTCTQAERDDAEVSARELGAAWRSLPRTREETKGRRNDLRERPRVEEEGPEAQVAASAVKREKAPRASFQQFKASKTKVASDEAEGMTRIEKTDDERARMDSTARDARSSDRQLSQVDGSCRLVETDQVSDEEEGEWVDVEETDGGINCLFEVNEKIVGKSESVHSGRNNGGIKMTESTDDTTQSIHSAGNNGLTSVVESAIGQKKTQGVRSEKTCENSQQAETIRREPTKLETLEAAWKSSDALTATLCTKVQGLAAELRAVRQKLRLSKEELRESMGAEVEAVLRVTEAEETNADLRLELEACKREIAELRKTKAPSHGQAQPL